MEAEGVSVDELDDLLDRFRADHLAARIADAPAPEAAVNRLGNFHGKRARVELRANGRPDLTVASQGHRDRQSTAGMVALWSVLGAGHVPAIYPAVSSLKNLQRAA